MISARACFSFLIAVMTWEYASSFTPSFTRRRQPSYLFISHRLNSASLSSDVSGALKDEKKPADKNEDDDRRLDLPWSDFQEWALRDNLSKYMVTIPAGDGGQQMRAALWRTMLRDVPELSGYPIPFLQQKYSQKVSKEPGYTDKVPEALPYLEKFEFVPSGGVSGIVFGVSGIADGSAIITPPVDNVEKTVPLGYVRTADGSVAYELGEPARDVYSMSLGGDGSNGRAQMLKAVARTATSVISATSSSMAKGAIQEENPDIMLYRLGASTGLLLASAAAFSVLSHHLTVNVFWV